LEWLSKFEQKKGTHGGMVSADEQTFGAEWQNLQANIARPSAGKR